ANAPQRHRRLKARKALRVYLKDAEPMLRGAIVSGEDAGDSKEHALWALCQHVIAEVGAGAVEVGRRRRRVLRKAINKLSARIAENRVLTKLRRSYAHILKEAPGKAAASIAAKALMLLGIPPDASEAVLRARWNRRADRLRKGGWSGVVDRTTDGQASLARNLVRDEGRRLAHGYQRAWDERRGRGGRRPPPPPGLYDDDRFEDPLLNRGAGSGAGRMPDYDERLRDRGVSFASEAELDRLIGAIDIGEVGAVLDVLGEPEYDGLTPHPVQDLETCV
ncbi:MAG: hypothetical protein AAGA54_35290, partial [Myxococcota bacterium]